MIELNRNKLVFTFPEVSPDAKLAIEFQRTLRIPDNDETYPLPPGLGRFPLKHVDDYANNVPAHWIDRGGVMLPMYQAEALWISFDANFVSGRAAQYPFAVKIAAGKIDAVTGEDWRENLTKAPQDYVVIPRQPWLDGYCVRRGVIRQFVAMPLGEGYTAEEQITGEAEHGGIQVKVFPMRREAFERWFPHRDEQSMRFKKGMTPEGAIGSFEVERHCDIGLAAGGQMAQEIYDDEFQFSDWDHKVSSRCFVHLANSQAWESITGKRPPTKPPTAGDYTKAGLPWFEYYDESPAVSGGKKLKDLKSVAKLGEEKRQQPLPENEAVDPVNVVGLRRGLQPGQVREGSF